jgi:hypothetical protein
MTGHRKDYGIKYPAWRVVVVALTVALVACKDDAPLPTGPTPLTPPTSQLATGTVQSSDPLSSRLSSTPGSCLIAERSAAGDYRSRTIAVSLPKQIAASSAATIEFAYRGWAATVPEPVVLALCNIPDSRTARAYFEKQFGGKSMTSAQLRNFAKSISVSGTDYWEAVGGPRIIHAASTSYVADGLASESQVTKSAPPGGVVGMLVPVCDPNTDPTCSGTPEDEYVPTEPPPPPPAFDPWVTQPAFPTPTYPTINCPIDTDYPHFSNSRPFYGQGILNVHGWTGPCNVPALISVSTTLGRQRCYIFRFCQWVAIATPGSKSWTGVFIEAYSNVACTWAIGWYLGVTQHSVSAFGYTVSKQSTSHYWTEIKCA